MKEFLQGVKSVCRTIKYPCSVLLLLYCHYVHLFLYCILNSYKAIWLSSHKCQINLSVYLNTKWTHGSENGKFCIFVKLNIVIDTQSTSGVL